MMKFKIINKKMIELKAEDKKMRKTRIIIKDKIHNEDCLKTMGKSATNNLLIDRDKEVKKK